MPTRASLPPQLTPGRWFRRGELDKLGVTAWQRRRLVSPHYGVYGVRMPQSVLEDAQAAELVLPGRVFFSHETAARLHELPLPGRWDPIVRPPLEVGVRTDPRPRLQSVRAHRVGHQLVRTGHVRGLRLPAVSRPDVFVQLAPRLGLTDLVVLGDAVVKWRGTYRKKDLEAALHPGMPGAGLAQRALGLVREDSNSPTETRTRLVLVGAGLPEPLLNAPIQADGRVLGYADFLWPEYKLVLEYHGGYHFETDAQRREDLRRIRALRDLGFRVEEITKEDLARPAELVTRIRRAMAEQAALLGR